MRHHCGVKPQSTGRSRYRCERIFLGFPAVRPQTKENTPVKIAEPQLKGREELRSYRLTVGGAFCGHPQERKLLDEVWRRFLAAQSL